MGKIKIELSMADKYYIEQHQTKKSLKELEKSIGKPQDLIKKYLDSLPKQTQTERYLDIVTSDEKAGKHIANKSGTTILTQTASEIADAHRVLPSATSKNKSDRIHRMK